MESRFIKNIVINDKMYELENKAISNPGFSGTCYRLKEGDLDLAVKIYHSEHPYGDDDLWYPDIDTLKYFIDKRENLSPIILSQYEVLDEYGNYVGCASPFVHETRGKTSETIWTLPRDLFFTYFYNLFKIVPEVSKVGIVLDDWSICNIKLGHPTGHDEGIYSFDDSNYYIDKDTTFNNLICDSLVKDIVSYYIEDKYTPDITNTIMKMLRNGKNCLAFLENNSAGYNCVGEFIDDYALVLKKKRTVQL